MGKKIEESVINNVCQNWIMVTLAFMFNKDEEWQRAKISKYGKE
jgi:hypothetical protein